MFSAALNKRHFPKALDNWCLNWLNKAPKSMGWVLHRYFRQQRLNEVDGNIETEPQKRSAEWK